MSDLDDLKSRMRAIEGATDAASKSGSGGTFLKVTAFLALLSIMGFGGFFVVNELNKDSVSVPIPTNEASQFPDDRDAGDTLALPEQPAPVVIERPVPTIVPDSAALARLEELEEELARAREAIELSTSATETERQLRLQIERERAERDEQIRSLTSAARTDQERTAAAIEGLERQISNLSTALEAAERSAESTQMELEMGAQERESELLAQLAELEQRSLEERTRLESEFEERQQRIADLHQQELDAARLVDPLEQERLAQEAERLRLEEERRARAEELRAQAEADRDARINSGLVALSNTGTEEAGSGGERRLSDNAAFVRSAIESVPLATADVFADPSSTVVQGTIIQAALEVAIDSSLPGNLRAVVSEDVFSMDGSRVLVPAGSKVFGEYSDGVITGQRRILIRWTRIITPFNQSVNISSFGADRLGRSGTGGAVDTRFGARFGQAALISIIGAVPDIIANNATDDENVQNTVEDIGDGFERATDNALNTVLSLQPIIFVKQGAQVSIIVDRDLEFS